MSVRGRPPGRMTVRHPYDGTFIAASARTDRSVAFVNVLIGQARLSPKDAVRLAVMLVLATAQCLLVARRAHPKSVHPTH